mmetsp:Transcript_46591/g.118144  ORF Transcript_46591/g.118144 Transcript_46591/m.118144 type:complete len:430 (+) Transcript_46591:1-1290(+)
MRRLLLALVGLSWSRCVLSSCEVDGRGGLAAVYEDISQASCLLQSSGRALLTTRQADKRRRGAVEGPFAERKHCNGIDDSGFSKCYPDLMFVGVSKCGTTSIVAYMSAHPQVIMQTWEEGKYGWTVNNSAKGDALTDQFMIGDDKNLVWESRVFDNHLKSNAQLQGLNWATAPQVPNADVGKYLQLHYTPNYFYFPDTPFHIADVYPNAHSIKYFVILRDPVKRAVSSWKFHRAVTWESRSFQQVVEDGISERQTLEVCYAAELAKKPASWGARVVEELPVERQRQVLNSCFWGLPDSHDRTGPMDFFHAHVDMGIYVDQLRRWCSILGRENLFVLSLEEWVQDPEAWYTDLAAFAGYEAVGPEGFRDRAELERVLSKKYNDGGAVVAPGAPKPEEPSAELKRRLAEFYAPYSEELFSFVGRRMWNASE